MKKITKLALVTCLMIATTSFSFADEMIFEPTEVGTNSALQGQPASITAQPQPEPKVIKTVTPAESSNFENAVLQLDSAQVQIRNDLMKLKDEYASVDAKYKAVKKQRSDLNKRVKATEKKIKKIEKTKETIKKEMI